MHLKLQWVTKKLPTRRPVVSTTLWSSETTSTSHLLSSCQATLKACFWRLWKKVNHLLPLPSGTDDSVVTIQTTTEKRGFFCLRHSSCPHSCPKTLLCILGVGFGCCFVLDTTGIHNNRVEVMELHGFQKKNGHLFPVVRVLPCKNSAITHPQFKTFLNSRILSSSKKKF